jgi:hypothetical protein
MLGGQWDLFYYKNKSLQRILLICCMPGNSGASPYPEQQHLKEKTPFFGLPEEWVIQFFSLIPHAGWAKLPSRTMNKKNE